MRFNYTSCQNKYDTGVVSEVLNQSPLRTTPQCEYYLRCGGCSLQHMDAKAQIEHKQNVLLELLKHLANVVPDEVLPPLTGPLWGYRHKARLGVRYVTKKETVLVGFREKYSNFLTVMDSCKVLPPHVSQLIKPLKLLLTQLEMRSNIAQIEVAVGEDSQTMLIFRNLKPLPESDKTALIQFAQKNKFEILLQPGGPITIYSLWPEKETLRLSYQIPQFNIKILFHPADFTQVNPEINQKMIAQAIDLLDLDATDKVLDLFCGLGNFTLPMAQSGADIIGIEGSDDLIARAKENAQANQINNTEFFSADLSKHNLATLPWAQANYNKLLLDPPRSGAQEVIQQLIHSRLTRIVYVSCNPATLARDAAILVENYNFRLKRVGVMDMFPQTSHVESIALFEKVL